MRRLLPLAIAVLLLSARTAAASEPAPDRPLAAGEDLSLSVAASGAIAIGELLASYDTTVGEGHHLQVLRLRVSERVKGPVSPGELRIVQWPGHHAPLGGKAGDRGMLHVSDRPRHVIVLLTDLQAMPKGPHDTYLGAAQGISRWATSEESNPFEVAGIQDWSTDLEARVRRELYRQGPQTLMLASDRVVLASFDTVGTGKHAFVGDRIRIEHTFKGPPAYSPLKLRTVVATEDPGPHAFLFLKQVGKDLYEPTVLGAGVVPIVGDQVPFWGMSLDRAISQIKAGTYRAR